MKIDQNVQKYWKKLQEINDIRINNINIYKQTNSNLVLSQEMEGELECSSFLKKCN